MSSLSRRASPLSRPRPQPPPPHIVSMIHGSFATADKLDFESVSFVSPNDDRRQGNTTRKEEGQREGSLQGCTEILIDQIRLRAEFRIMNERPKSNAVFGIDCGARDRSRVGMKSGILAESNRRNTEERERERSRDGGGDEIPFPGNETKLGGGEAGQFKTSQQTIIRKSDHHAPNWFFGRGSRLRARRLN